MAVSKEEILLAMGEISHNLECLEAALKVDQRNAGFIKREQKRLTALLNQYQKESEE